MLRKISKKLFTMDIYYQCFQCHTQRNKFCERLTASNILECKKQTPHLNILVSCQNVDGFLKTCLCSHIVINIL